MIRTILAGKVTSIGRRNRGFKRKASMGRGGHETAKSCLGMIKAGIHYISSLHLTE